MASIPTLPALVALAMRFYAGSAGRRPQPTEPERGKVFDSHGPDEAVVDVPHIIAAIVNGTGCQLAALKHRHRQGNAKTSDVTKSSFFRLSNFFMRTQFSIRRG